MRKHNTASGEFSGRNEAALRIEFSSTAPHSAKAYVLGHEAHELQFAIGDEDADQALTLIRQLNKLRLSNGTYLPSLLEVDGFEPWWFIQETLFRQVLLPYTKYHPLIERMLASRSVEIVNCPQSFLTLLRALSHSGNAPRFHILDSKPIINNFGLRAARIIVRWILRIETALASTWFRFRHPELVLYIVDKVTPHLGHDFRLSPIYAELTNREFRFTEYVHVGELREVISNLLRRKRPVIYYEFAKNTLTQTIRPPDPKVELNLDVTLPDLTDADGAFLQAAAAYGLSLAHASTRRYHALKQKIRSQHPKFALVMDDSRHSHEFVAACKELGVYVLGYQHGLGHITKYSPGLACYGFGGARPHRFDAYGLWSEHFRNKLHSFSELYSSDVTFVSGVLRPPNAEELLAISLRRTRQGQDIEVLLVSEPHSAPSVIRPIVEQLLSDTRISLSLKIRPGEEYSQVQDFWGDLAEKMQIVESPSVYTAFAGADVVMGMYSSVLYEGVLALKPIVVLNANSQYAIDLPEFGLADSVDTQESVLNTTIQAANLPIEELKRRRQLLWGSNWDDPEGVSRLFMRLPKSTHAR